VLQRLLAMAIVMLIATGCVNEPFNNGNAEAEKTLATGIHQYEEGNYKAAQIQIQNALDKGLRTYADKATAHKYLAFIHCASYQERACREEFRLVFELNPNFELSPAEQGHPLWAPVYRSVRANMGLNKNSSR